MLIRLVSASFALILISLASAQTAIPPVPKPLDFPPPKLLPAGKGFPVTDFGAVPDGKTLNEVRGSRRTMIPPARRRAGPAVQGRNHEAHFLMQLSRQ